MDRRQPQLIASGAVQICRAVWRPAGLEVLPGPGPGGMRALDFSALSESGPGWLAGSLELTLLDRLNGLGVVAADGRQRTDSTHVLGWIRGLGRLELAGESVQAALVALAAAALCRTLRVRPEIRAPSAVITQQGTHRGARDRSGPRSAHPAPRWRPTLRRARICGPTVKFPWATRPCAD
jgi:hypothetical protein